MGRFAVIGIALCLFLLEGSRAQSYSDYGSSSWPGYSDSSYGDYGSSSWPSFSDGSSSWPGYSDSSYGDYGSSSWPGYSDSSYGDYGSSSWQSNSDWSSSWPGYSDSSYSDYWSSSWPSDWSSSWHSDGSSSWQSNSDWSSSWPGYSDSSYSDYWSSSWPSDWSSSWHSDGSSSWQSNSDWSSSWPGYSDSSYSDHWSSSWHSDWSSSWHSDWSGSWSGYSDSSYGDYWSSSWHSGSSSASVSTPTPTTTTTDPPLPCQIGVSNIPDKYRRSPNYRTLGLREPLISDDTLTEQWYNLGDYVGSLSAEIGYCGTVYPIVLKEEVPDTDVQLMENGLVLVKLVGIYSYDDYHTTAMEWAVSIRMCGGMYQALLPPSPVPFSAYCLEKEQGDFTWSSVSIQNDRAFVIPTIEFWSDGYNYIPRIWYECFQVYNMSMYGNPPTNTLFHSVAWYINDNQVQSYEQVSGTLRIDEETLVSKGLVLGDTVKCMYSRYKSGEEHPLKPVFSDGQSTGIKMQQFNSYVADGDQMLLSYFTESPLACTTNMNDPDAPCEIFYPIVGAQCSAGGCGVIVRGLTKADYENTTNDAWRGWNYASGANMYGIGQRFQDWDNMGTYNSTQHSLRFDSPTWTSGFEPNMAWRTYVHPSIYVNRLVNPPQNDWATARGSDITWQHLDGPTQTAPVPGPGTFCLYRSTHYPVAVQIKTAQIGDAIEICGVAVVNDNANYVMDACDGRPFIASKSWRNVYSAETGWTTVVNGLSGEILYDEHEDGSVSNIGISINGSASTIETLEDGECIVGGGNWSSASSWLVASSESLWNYANAEIQYGGWETTVHECECPGENYNASDVPAGIILNGEVYCTPGCIETETKTGVEWPQTVVRSFNNLIGSVEIFRSQDISRVGLFCNFSISEDPDIRYGVSWFRDGFLISSSQQQPWDNVDSIQVYNPSSYQEWNIDKPYQCAVTIYDQTGSTTLLGPELSGPFTILKVLTSNVTMPRGGTAEVVLEFCSPTVCANDNCEAEFRLYDDTATDCGASSIAALHQSTCGNTVSIDSVGTSCTNVSIYVTSVNDFDPGIFRHQVNLHVRGILRIGGVVEHDSVSSQGIQAMIVDGSDLYTWQYCFVFNDPRVITFQSRFFGINRAGVFDIFVDDDRGIKIEIFSETCRPSGFGHCACGVAVRYGQDVVIMNHCSDMHYVNSLRYDTGALRVYEYVQNVHRVVFPHGMTVWVFALESSNWLSSVLIIPTAADVGRGRGICGSVDDTNQLVFRDGTSVQLDNDYYFTNTLDIDNFVDSWVATEPLLDQTVVEGLPAMQQDPYCRCPSGGQPISGLNSDDVCPNVVAEHGRPLHSNFGNSNRNGTSWGTMQNIAGFLASETRRKRSTCTGMSEDDARTLCTQELNQSCQVYQNASSSPTPTVGDDMLNACISDNMVCNGSWSRTACENGKVSVIQALERNSTFQNESVDYVTNIQNVCMEDCNNNGICRGGTCECYQGYAGDLCQQSETVGPEPVTMTDEETTCDLNGGQEPCNTLAIRHGGSTTTPYCHVTVHGVLESGQSPQWAFSYVTRGTYVSYNAAECPTSLSRRRRSTASSHLMKVYEVSLSNNGVNTGSSTAFVAFDSTCVQINITASLAFLTPGYCFIEGSCYVDGDAQATDACNLCDTSSDLYVWTRDNSTGCEVKASDDEDDAYVVPVAVIMSLLGAALICGGIAFAVYKLKFAKETTVHPPPNDLTLYGGPPLPKFKLRPDVIHPDPRLTPVTMMTLENDNPACTLDDESKS